MARRSNRRTRGARRADPLPPVPPPSGRSAPLSSQRSTFRVAQAQRAIARDLPDVIYNSTRDRAKASPRRAVAAPLSAGSGLAPRVSAKRPAPEKVKPAPLSMDKPRHCKPRPDHTRKSGGGSGPSKDFVPWCK